MFFVQRSQGKTIMNKKKSFNTRNLIIAATGFLAPLVPYLSLPGATFSGIGILTLIEFIPYFIVLDALSPRFAVLYSGLYGIVFYGLAAFGMTAYGSGAILGCAIGYWGQLLFGLMLFAMIGGFTKYFMVKTKTWWPLFAGLVFCVYCWAMNGDWVLANPMFNFVSGLWRLPLLIQTADIWGMEGLAFCVVFLQATLYRTVRHFVFHEKTSKGLVTENILCICLALFIVIYGIVSLYVWNEKAPKGYVSIAAVQHNGINGREKFAERNLNAVKEMVEEAAKTAPGLIAWADTACFTSTPAIKRNNMFNDPDSPYYETIYGRELRTLEDLSSLYGIPILSSGIDIISDSVITEKDMVKQTMPDDVKILTSSYLFEDGSLKLDQTAYKECLAPFAETLPSFIKMYLSGSEKYFPGPQKTISVADTLLACMLCYENQIPTNVSKMVRNGAGLIINQGSTYASRGTSYSVSHAATTLFRSVENRRGQLRCYNSGYSIWISPAGEILDELPLEKTATGTCSLPIYEELTFFTKHPGWFGFAALIILGLAVVYTGMLRESTKRRRLFSFLGIAAITYILLSLGLDLGWHFAVATMLMIPSGVFMALAATEQEKAVSVKDAGIVIATLILCLAGMFVFGAGIGLIPIKGAVQELDAKNVPGTIYGTWENSREVKESIVRAGRKQDSSYMQKETIAFREDGRFAMDMLYYNTNDNILTSFYKGEWSVQDDRLRIKAYSEQTGDYIGSDDRIYISEMNGKEVLVMETDTGSFSYHRKN